MLSFGRSNLAAAVLAASILWTGHVVAADGEVDDAGLAFFEKRIRPVLVEQCYSCHAVDAKSVRGGLVVDSRDGLLVGGDSGAAIVPGKPDESLLIEALRYESYEMPPKGKLPQPVIDDFVKWVEMGAPDPRDGQAKVAEGGIDLEQGRQHWSFQPVKRHPVPAPQSADWAAGPIDRFILDRLEQEGLQPAADADRRTLLRRVTFDLTGLPPTPAEIDAFLADDSPDAFEKVVDRLLDSPHFGERWGRHWLDVARFAESTGGGRSLLYQVSWQYRDYVVRAFNEDKPFDRFIIEQIAGDLLPYDDAVQGRDQLVATAFLALGPHNYENQDKEQLRMDVIDEQIDVTGRAFLALTIGCARCHDHKFDPVPTADYYALAGIFRSTNSLVDGNVSRWVSRPLPLPAEQQRQLDEHNRAVARVTKELKARSSELEQLQSQLPAVTVDDDKATLTGEWTPSTSIGPFVARGYRHAKNSNATATFRLTLPRAGRYAVRIAYTASANRSPNARVRVHYAGGVDELQVNQQKKPTLDGLYFPLGEYVFDGEAVVEFPVENTTGHVIIDAVQAVCLEPADGEVAKELAERAEQARALEETITQLQQSLQELEENKPPKAVEVMAVEEADEIGDYAICIRGNVHKLGDRVPRGFLSVIPIEQPAISDDSSGRLELARWIAHPDNPLTPRVAVNRIWHHLFGQGIVRTVDNFGVPGELPSHPELLDYLASQLIDSGWSNKQMVREIVLSRTYRLSSDRGERAIAADAENRWLAGQNRRRLEAEAIYDSVLSLSGQLDRQTGGDTVRPGTRSEYGYRFDTGRRAIYLPVFRNRLHDLLTVFDFPNPNLSNGRRKVTTLATQALFLMNSPFIWEQSRLTAERLLADESLTDSERLAQLYQWALGREPSSAERELALKYLAADSADPVEMWGTLCQAVIASVDFRYVY
ncbi:Planctomycete cytochrome C [Maioricimonas rarisocia]|uniref:Planctomycete cytochrome C n=1 Tax=Maioricimonas rarisocia TaxID=2528026 RepID=A0A517Z8U0_9PLAN|nr:DUF1553 domain-containing protein [Maioricimonas rarisocia]QDU38910.1 Planctomycete cytochrome C [Maioricimonas rarisocia]